MGPPAGGGGAGGGGGGGGGHGDSVIAGGSQALKLELSQRQPGSAAVRLVTEMSQKPTCFQGLAQGIFFFFFFFCLFRAAPIA